MKAINPLPQHRQNIIEALMLAMDGKKVKANSKLKQAKKQSDKFYKNRLQ